MFGQRPRTILYSLVLLSAWVSVAFGRVGKPDDEAKATKQGYRLRDRPTERRLDSTMKFTMAELHEYQLTLNDESPPKQTEQFLLQLFDTDGNLPEESQETVATALENFLMAELNEVYKPIHPVEEVWAEFSSQDAISSGSSATGSELLTSVSITFDREPSPDSAQLELWVETVMSDLTNFIANITALDEGEDPNLADIMYANREPYYQGTGNRDDVPNAAITPEETSDTSQSNLRYILPTVFAGLLVASMVGVFALLHRRRKHTLRQQSVVKNNKKMSPSKRPEPVSVLLDEDSDVFSFEVALTDSPAVHNARKMKLAKKEAAENGGAIPPPGAIKTAESHDSDLFSGINSPQPSSPGNIQESKSVFSFLSNFTRASAATVPRSNVTNSNRTASGKVQTAAKVEGSGPETPRSYMSSLFAFSEEDENQLDTSDDEEAGNDSKRNNGKSVTGTKREREELKILADMDISGPEQLEEQNDQQIANDLKKNASKDGKSSIPSTPVEVPFDEEVPDVVDVTDDSSSVTERSSADQGEVSRELRVPSELSNEEEYGPQPLSATQMGTDTVTYDSTFLSTDTQTYNTTFSDNEYGYSDTDTGGATSQSYDGHESNKLDIGNEYGYSSDTDTGGATSQSYDESNKLDSGNEYGYSDTDTGDANSQSYDESNKLDSAPLPLSNSEVSGVRAHCGTIPNLGDKPSSRNQSASSRSQSAMGKSPRSQSSVSGQRKREAGGGTTPSSECARETSSVSGILADSGSRNTASEARQMDTESRSNSKASSSRKWGIGSLASSARGMFNKPCVDDKDDDDHMVDVASLEGQSQSPSPSSIDLQWNNPGDPSRNSAIAASSLAANSEVDDPRTGRRHAKSMTGDGTKAYQSETMAPADWSLASGVDNSGGSTDIEPSVDINEVLTGPKPYQGQAEGETPRSNATNDSTISGLSLTTDGTESLPQSPSKKLISDLVWLEKKIAGTAKNVATGDRQSIRENSGGAATAPPKIDASDSMSFESKDEANVISNASGDSSSLDLNPYSGSLPKGVQSIVCRDCFAPPGKLKIVIHSTKDGPAVHTVKKGSSLEGHIFSGDLIISVDNVDTRSLSAEQIMKMMTARTRYERKITVLHFEEESE